MAWRSVWELAAAVGLDAVGDAGGPGLLEVEGDPGEGVLVGVGAVTRPEPTHLAEDGGPVPTAGFQGGENRRPGAG